MSGHKCMYYMCGKTTRMQPGLKMFRIPVKDGKRSRKWILNSGKCIHILPTFKRVLFNRAPKLNRIMNTFDYKIHKKRFFFTTGL